MAKLTQKSKLKYRLLSLNRKPKSIYSPIGFHYYKTIFFHIPKTGGVSVSKSLFKNLGLGHIDVTTARSSFLPPDFDDYFKFSFVRNPYTRLYSAYFFLKNGGYDVRDDTWAKRNLGGYNSFTSFVREWLTPENCLLKNHFKPQYNFLINPITDENEMDFVGRFESLVTDYHFVANKLNIKRKLLFENKTKTNKFNSVQLPIDVKKKIVACYERDFDIFEYPTLL